MSTFEVPEGMQARERDLFSRIRAMIEALLHCLHQMPVSDIAHRSRNKLSLRTIRQKGFENFFNSSVMHSRAIGRLGHPFSDMISLLAKIGLQHFFHAVGVGHISGSTQNIRSLKWLEKQKSPASLA
ncbi:hypothetical protein GAO09_15890 [Rhizobiales bacterium RZME27]|uniref:Uncharacterized protein n=1 Tax=Endobacterium cereale TaxID=2663029 RepID=A0A6A8AE75_9HYPH|nr:hypothetical protein [Endobacterium cereale]MEB2847067.1 hypothetical protein [Endobacterium cereale]MQY47516.1 hypothetical protein [Endobacterium cereale]